jgi:hypothetical protein
MYINLKKKHQRLGLKILVFQTEGHNFDFCADPTENMSPHGNAENLTDINGFLGNRHIQYRKWYVFLAFSMATL